ncbi:hypothetical protein ACTWPB_00995 [Nocardia sp. IBHARD005]|uniref:hypothetical protein n=1 Tax=Nocardia sp. IBHARD005 TaxID=3457765 RepID=UPI0040594DDF
MVNYRYYAGSHFGSDSGTIDYLIDLAQATVSRNEHVRSRSSGHQGFSLSGDVSLVAW